MPDIFDELEAPPQTGDAFDQLDVFDEVEAAPLSPAAVEQATSPIAGIVQPPSLAERYTPENAAATQDVYNQIEQENQAKLAVEKPLEWLQLTGKAENPDEVIDHLDQVDAARPLTKDEYLAKNNAFKFISYGKLASSVGQGIVEPIKSVAGGIVEVLTPSNWQDGSAATAITQGTVKGVGDAVSNYILGLAENAYLTIDDKILTQGENGPQVGGTGFADLAYNAYLAKRTIREFTNKINTELAAENGAKDLPGIRGATSLALDPLMYTGVGAGGRASSLTGKAVKAGTALAADAGEAILSKTAKATGAAVDAGIALNRSKVAKAARFVSGAAAASGVYAATQSAWGATITGGLAILGKPERIARFLDAVNGKALQGARVAGAVAKEGATIAPETAFKRVAQNTAYSETVRRAAATLDASPIARGSAYIGSMVSHGIDAGLTNAAIMASVSVDPRETAAAFGSGIPFGAAGRIGAKGEIRKAWDQYDMQNLMSRTVADGGSLDAVANMQPDVALHVARSMPLWGKEAKIQVLEPDAFNAVAPGAKAAYHYRPQNPDGTFGEPTIYINAKTDKATFDHEIGHSVAMSKLADGRVRADISDTIDRLYTPDDISKRAEEYAGKMLAAQRKLANDKRPVEDYEIKDFVSRKGEFELSQGRPADAWIREELSAELLRTGLKGIDMQQMRRGWTGDAKTRALRAQAAILRNQGVPIDRTGRVVISGELFSDHVINMGNRELAARVSAYINDYRDHGNALAEKAVKGEKPIKFNRSPNERSIFAESLKNDGRMLMVDMPDGTRENELFREANGRREWKGQQEIKDQHTRRMQAMVALKNSLPRVQRGSKQLGHTYTAGDVPIIYGQVLPDRFYSDPTIGQHIQRFAAALEKAINDGGSVIMDWHQVGKNDKGTYKVDKMIAQGSGRTNEVRPFAFSISKDGNILVHGLEMEQVYANFQKAMQDPEAQRLFADEAEMLDVFNKVIENHNKGLAGDYQIAGDPATSKAQYDWINAATGLYSVRRNADKNPVAVRTKFPSAIKTPRLDRIMSVREGNPDGFAVDYEKWAKREMPDAGKAGEVESIRRAAFKMEDGRIFDGPTHMEAGEKANEAGYSPTDANAGFLTTNKRFLTRKEAFDLAIKNKQTSLDRDTFDKGDLHSGKLDYTADSRIKRAPKQPIRFMPDSRAANERPIKPMRNGGVTDGPGLVSIGDIRYLPAHHGTPHKVDKFSLDKIGTGEGAQAYGWGLYFAEDRNVAETYRKQLSGFDELTIHTAEGKKKGAELDEIDLEVAKYIEAGERAAGQFKHNTAYYAKQKAEAAGRQDVVERLEKYGRDVRVGYEKNNGTLFTVDLDVKPEELLDWDKPMGGYVDGMAGMPWESPDIWKRIVDEARDVEDPDFPGEGREFEYENATGEAVYAALVDKYGSAENASKHLASLGIKGIRYLDGASRSDGKGSYNYVIFDESRIKILEENGKPRKPLPSSALDSIGGTGDVRAMPDVRPRKFKQPIWADELKSAGGNIDADGTVLLFHATTQDTAKKILESGLLKRPADAPDSYGVYASSSEMVADDYGDGTLVPIRVRVEDLNPDDSFPGRRIDFMIPTRGGVYRPVAVGEKALRK